MRTRLFMAGLAALGAFGPISAQALEPQPLVFSAWTDRLEYQVQQGKNAFLWDANAWLGKDLNKAWIRTEGSLVGSTVEDGEVEALWSHAVAPFWDFQAGVRQDFGAGPDRTHAVLGIEGIAPGWFEVTADMFVSQKGDVTARFEAEYDMRITERLILQPRTEINVAFQDVPALGVGEALSDFSLDLRLRYKIRQEFAPYIGVSWTRKMGSTADFARLAGERVGTVAFVTGVRLQY